MGLQYANPSGPVTIGYSTEYSSIKVPVDRGFVQRPQVVITLGEVTRAQKPLICRVGRWMSGFQHQMPSLTSKYFFVFMFVPFSWAKLPQRKNTTPWHFSSIILITSSVNLCHPHSECELADPFLTVSVAFSISTPCFAQLVRSP